MNFMGKKLSKQRYIEIFASYFAKPRKAITIIWMCGISVLEIQLENSIWIIGLSNCQKPQNNVGDASSHNATFANNEHFEQFIRCAMHIFRKIFNFMNRFETDDDIIWKRVCLLGGDKSKQTIKFHIEIALAALFKGNQLESNGISARTEGNTQFKNRLQITESNGNSNMYQSKHWIRQPNDKSKKTTMCIISWVRSTETEISIKWTI